MREVSIISVAFGKDYQRFIKPFKDMASQFSDDVIIETRRSSMGTMRNRACKKAKYKYIISLDIDDELLRVPSPKSDFVGLGWSEHGENKSYWLPGEERSLDNTIRSNVMFSKILWLESPFIDNDYYIYNFIESAYRNGFTFSKSDVCLVYNRRNGSASSIISEEDRTQADKVLRRLMVATNGN